MEQYILDTNIFFNMEAGINLGKTTEEIIKYMTSVAKKTKQNKNAEFYMPPKIVDEFLSFFEDKNQLFLKEFLAQIHIKSPEINNITIHAALFYQLVEDIRGRSYRGMSIAEEEIQEAVRLMTGQSDLDKKKFQIKIGAVVKKFRN